MRWSTLAAVILAAAPLQAATITGTVTAVSSGPLNNMEVRAWRQETKSYSLADSVTTDGAGFFQISGLPSGTYKVDVRNGVGNAVDYAERWYSTRPGASGYVPEDADAITLSSSGTRNGADVAMQRGGGLDGMLTGPSGPQGSMRVRAEWASDFRVHHNDISKTIVERRGEYSMRALPPGQHRVLAWDLNAQFETTVVGPRNVAVGAVANAGNATVTAMGADPLEPNDVVSDSRSTISSARFRQQPPQPFVTTTSLIGPRNTGDVDLYCFDVVFEDRFLIEASGLVRLEDNSTREHPYVDTVVALFADPPGFPGGFTSPDGGMFARPDGLRLVGVNDDVSSTSRASRLDTGVLDQAGRYCAAVTTYGDVNYAGSNQGSAGRYSVRIEMGNRPPRLSATLDVDGLAAAPPVITLDEDQTLNGVVAFEDPDGDALTATWELRDGVGGMAAGASFNTSNPTAALTWLANQTSARLGPYQLVITLTDGEFTRTITANVVVNNINIPPPMPLQLTPVDQAIISTNRPLLVCSSVYDVDLDPLLYEFELSTVDEDGGVPIQTASLSLDGGVNPDAAGTVGWRVDALEENTAFQWRVRAYDGNSVNGHSMWTGVWRFFVNSRNDPPAVPQIVKPADGEEVMLRRPVISSTNVVDPEGDEATVIFDVASDDAFTTGVITSPAVPVSTTGDSTMWMLTQDLTWGSSYFARVHAEDSLGAVSAHSATVSFHLRENVAPTVTLGAPFETECADTLLTVTPTEILVNVTDPEAEPVTVSLQIFYWVDNPDTGIPVYTRNRTATGSSVAFDVATLEFTRNYKYRLRTRGSDGTDTSDWTECGLTVNPPVVVSSSSSAATVSSVGASSAELPSSSAIMVVSSSGASTTSSRMVTASSTGGGLSQGNSQAEPVSTDNNIGDGGGEGPGSCGCNATALHGDGGRMPLVSLGVLLMALWRVRKSSVRR